MFRTLFKGRIDRKNYILGLFITLLTAASCVYVLFNTDLNDLFYIPLTLFELYACVLLISVITRRANDIKDSDWQPFKYVLLGGASYLLFFKEGENSSNKYGEKPNGKVNITKLLIG